MSLKVLLYLNIIILVISCLFDFINKSIIPTNLKLLLICTLIIIHLLRQKENFSIFVNNDTNKIKDNGGFLTTVEMILFHIQKDARGDKFRKLVSLVK